LTAKAHKCVICDSTDIEIFIEIFQVPVYCNVLWPTREAALNAPRADMRLGFCHNCYHVYNYAFDPDKLDYTLNYENSLHFSPRFQEYARALAHRLTNRHNLFSKDIIEIGCGSGEFLSLLCKLGGNRGVGFDPSSASARVSDQNNRVTFVRDFYSERYPNYKTDFICCRHVLEHIQSPHDFLLQVRNAIGVRKTVVFFEVPNFMFTLRDFGIWDVIYEHCSYFSKRSLAHLFKTCGFKVTDLRVGFDGQFLCIEAIPMDSQASTPDYSDDGQEKIEAHIHGFRRRYDSKVKEWRRNLEDLKDAGKRTVTWGAGSKGATFLNTLRECSEIEYVVDINPRKQGMYMASTGQKIISAEFLREYQPGIIIVMNPTYLAEIKKTVRSMKLFPKIIPV
jgi:SAM-dependent methyltransferase